VPLIPVEAGTKLKNGKREQSPNSTESTAWPR
jgi:hypothetical protein